MRTAKLYKFPAVTFAEEIDESPGYGSGDEPPRKVAKRWYFWLAGILAVWVTSIWWWPRMEYALGKYMESRNPYGTYRRDLARQLYERAGDPYKLIISTYVPAQERLAHFYATGAIKDSTGRNLALLWGMRAYSTGSIQAANSLGYSFDMGLGNAERRRQPSEAFSYYLQAASKGNALGMCNAGTRYLTGIGAIQDYAKAFELITNGASQPTQSSCKYKLALMYENGWGVSVSLRKAFSMYEELSTREIYPEAILHLAGMLADGRGARQNQTRAMELLEDWQTYVDFDRYEESSPVEMGDWAYMPVTSKAYIDAKRVELVAKLANLGQPDAQLELAQRYEAGNALPKDPALALAWYQRAADNKVTVAESWLGLHYLGGASPPGKHALAVSLLERAARKCDVSSQVALAHLADKASSASENNIRAMVWAGVAAAHGNEEAALIRDRVRSALAAADFQSIQEKIRLEWQKQQCEQ
jgi:uncharacterized protein